MSDSTSVRPPWIKHLLWFDCLAGTSVGLGMLALMPWLSDWYGLPSGLVLFVALANCGAGAYSFSLARKRRREPQLIALLVVGNGTWALICAALFALFLNEARIWGLLHLAGEALFVGGLAMIEWRCRHDLVTGEDPADPAVA